MKDNVFSFDIEIVKKSFEFCGITTTDKSLVKNGRFYELCMQNASEHFQQEDISICNFKYFFVKNKG